MAVIDDSYGTGKFTTGQQQPPWVIEDKEYFEAHPEKKWRLRATSPDELFELRQISPKHVSTCEEWAKVLKPSVIHVLVINVAPGVRGREVMLLREPHEEGKHTVVKNLEGTEITIEEYALFRYETVLKSLSGPTDD